MRAAGEFPRSPPYRPSFPHSETAAEQAQCGPHRELLGGPSSSSGRSLDAQEAAGCDEGGSRGGADLVRTSTAARLPRNKTGGKQKDAKGPAGQRLKTKTVQRISEWGQVSGGASRADPVWVSQTLLSPCPARPVRELDWFGVPTLFFLGRCFFCARLRGGGVREAGVASVRTACVYAHYLALQCTRYCEGTAEGCTLVEMLV